MREPTWRRPDRPELCWPPQRAGSHVTLFRWLEPQSSTDKEVNVLAVTFLGISIAGRELLIIGAVVVIIVLIGIVLMQRRPPK